MNTYNDYGTTIMTTVSRMIVTIFLIIFLFRQLCRCFPGHPTLRIQDMVESMLHFSGGWVAEDSNENRLLMDLMMDM